MSSWIKCTSERNNRWCPRMELLKLGFRFLSILFRLFHYLSIKCQIASELKSQVNDWENRNNLKINTCFSKKEDWASLLGGKLRSSFKEIFHSLRLLFNSAPSSTWGGKLKCHSKSLYLSEFFSLSISKCLASSNETSIMLFVVKRINLWAASYWRQ